MLARFRQAIFGLPLFVSPPSHTTYSGPTTSTAIQAMSTAASNGAAKFEQATVSEGGKCVVYVLV